MPEIYSYDDEYEKSLKQYLIKGVEDLAEEKNKEVRNYSKFIVSIGKREEVNNILNYKNQQFSPSKKDDNFKFDIEDVRFIFHNLTKILSKLNKIFDIENQNYSLN